MHNITEVNLAEDFAVVFFGGLTLVLVMMIPAEPAFFGFCEGPDILVLVPSGYLT